MRQFSVDAALQIFRFQVSQPPNSSVRASAIDHVRKFQSLFSNHHFILKLANDVIIFSSNYQWATFFFSHKGDEILGSVLCSSSTFTTAIEPLYNYRFNAALCKVVCRSCRREDAPLGAFRAEHSKMIDLDVHDDLCAGRVSATSQPAPHSVRATSEARPHSVCPSLLRPRAEFRPREPESKWLFSPSDSERRYEIDFFC